jgi:hypothetical protein
MKVLITGCSAQQASKKHAQRTPTFASLLARAFRDAGVEADHVEPSLTYTAEELSQYDLVVVGITPPASITANKIYPAFSMAAKAQKIGNLALMIDAPDSMKIQPSLKSCYSDPDSFYKDFYNRRKNYSEVVTDENLRAEIQGFINFLIEQKWPTTFYPIFPWSTKKFSEYLPNLDEQHLMPINVDSYLIFQAPIVQNYYETKQYWTCDALTSPYGVSHSMMVRNAVVATRETRWEPQIDTLERIRSSIGTLVATYRNDESWWSPALAQSLSQNVPVVHDWKLTHHLGPEWSHLASNIEDMGTAERLDVAYHQKQSYLKQIPTQEETSHKLLATLRQLV